MVSKRLEIQARKDRVLAMTIDHYVKTVSPISSSFIASEYPSDVSSATVRNIFAELEEDGYLTHPHTSAGRVPTQKGYRYYVDNLMNELHLLEEEKSRIKAEYAAHSKELESLLDKTSQVLSNVTEYTSIISVDGWGKKIFCRGTNYVVNYPDEQNMEKIEKILFALEEKDKLLKIINQTIAKKVQIYIGQEIALTQINSCSLVVSSFQTKKGPTGKIAVLGPTRMNYERVVSALDYFSNLIEEMI